MEDKHLFIIGIIACLVIITFSTVDLLNCVNDEGEIEIQNSISLKIAIILASIFGFSFIGIIIDTDLTVSFYLLSMMAVFLWGFSLFIANELVKLIIFVPYII